VPPTTQVLIGRARRTSARAVGALRRLQRCVRATRDILDQLEFGFSSAFLDRLDAGCARGKPALPRVALHARQFLPRSSLLDSVRERRNFGPALAVSHASPSRSSRRQRTSSVSGLACRRRERAARRTSWRGTIARETCDGITCPSLSATSPIAGEALPPALPTSAADLRFVRREASLRVVRYKPSAAEARLRQGAASRSRALPMLVMRSSGSGFNVTMRETSSRFASLSPGELASETRRLRGELAELLEGGHEVVLGLF